MKKITVFIENHKRELVLNPAIIVPANSTLFLKNATVYWKYDNILSGKNDEIFLKKSNPTTTEKITFEEGYWNFLSLKERLSLFAVKLDARKFNNKCQIKSTVGDLELKNFGPLLGFPKDTVIRQGAWVTSTNTVNVNQNFKYINVNCSIVNTQTNHNTKGNKSLTLASLPVTTTQALNGSSTFYKGVNSEVSIQNGCFNRIFFDVEANNGLSGACVDVLLELYVKT